MASAAEAECGTLYDNTQAGQLHHKWFCQQTNQTTKIEIDGYAILLDPRSSSTETIQYLLVTWTHQVWHRQDAENQQNQTILVAIKQVKSVHAKRGFRIHHMLMDGQFESFRAYLADLRINLNTVSADEHIPEIVRCIRTVKERTCCICNTLPFQQIPPRMIIEMVYSSNFWLNSFPPDDGVSNVLSPRAIVAGMELNYAKYCQLKFGTYVQTHKQHDNSMATSTAGAIALRPTGNNQSGYYFYSLTTGQCINRNQWTSLPMPNNVIDSVCNLARQACANIGLLFTDCHGHPLINDHDDDDSKSDDET
jgi:hypothetical protein